MKICSQAVHVEKWGARQFFLCVCMCRRRKSKSTNDLHMGWPSNEMEGTKLYFVEILSFSIYHLNPLCEFSGH